MSHYGRSVLFRVAGAFAGAALWFGLIVVALVNLDAPVGVPEELGATWPFWATGLMITAFVYFARRRLGPGPGWGAFAVGVIAPFVGLFMNARLGGGGGLWFWLPILVIVFVPWPAASRDPLTESVSSDG